MLNHTIMRENMCKLPSNQFVNILLCSELKPLLLFC